VSGENGVVPITEGQLDFERAIVLIFYSFRARTRARGEKKLTSILASRSSRTAGAARRQGHERRRTSMKPGRVADQVMRMPDAGVSIGQATAHFFRNRG